MQHWLMPALALMLTPGAAAAFTISFDWEGLKRCTNGSPNTVPNPTFILTDVPEGTKFIRFKMLDRNAPSDNHGGGVVAWDGQDVIAPGAFKYKSPCPPSGPHMYEWQATAQTEKSGGKIATTKAQRPYP